MQEHGFEKPNIEKAPKVKNQRGMDRIITDVFMSLSDINPIYYKIFQAAKS